MYKSTKPFDFVAEAKRRMLDRIVASNPWLFDSNRRPANQRPSGKTPTSR
ncbi:hypothetical protein PV762_08370 [Mitsuaria sp. CC2]|jgi:hypothetical protein